MIRKRKFGMPAAAYDIVGAVIRKIADPALRKTVADHFATEFHARSDRFDAYQWEKATGGRPQKRKSLMTDDTRNPRVPLVT